MKITSNDVMACLRVMGNAALNSFTHLFSSKTTLIDCKTGKIIGHYTREELEKLNTDS